MPKIALHYPRRNHCHSFGIGHSVQKRLKPLLHRLDRYRGIYLSSGYEYPERYSR